MTKIFCDCCGKEIERIKTDYTRMAFGSNVHAEEKHFHIECAVRINNLIDSFCHAVQHNEVVTFVVNKGGAEDGI